MAFSFEKLDVYRKSLALVKNVEILSKELKGKVSYSLIDQLIRAASSVPLNIAEGSGRWHKGERKHFFMIARGSVFEVVPLIHVFRDSGHMDQNRYEHFYQGLEDLSKMLYRMIEAVDRIKR